MNKATAARFFLLAVSCLLAAGCATTGMTDKSAYPYDPWYADLKPFSRDRTTDWALFDLGYPTLPDLRDPSDNPFYDMEALLR